MQRWIRALVVLYCCSTLLAKSRQSPHVVIDGNPDEPFWQVLAPMKLVPKGAGIPADLGGEMRAAIAGPYLYLGARLPEPTERVTARSIGRNPIWEGGAEARDIKLTQRYTPGTPEGEDFIRFFIRVSNQDDWMVQIGPLGGYSVDRTAIGEREWNTAPIDKSDRFLVAAQTGEKEWSVEAAIPLDQLGSPLPGQVRLSVERYRAARPNQPSEQWGSRDEKPTAVVPTISGEGHDIANPVFQPTVLGNREPPIEVGYRKGLPPLREQWTDPGWRDVPSWSLRRNEASARLPRFPTEVKLLQDGHILAVLARCIEPDEPQKVWHEYGRCPEMAKCIEPGSVLAKPEGRDGDVEGDDSFQVYLATSGSYYVQYAINPFGDILDALGHQGNPNLSGPNRHWNSPVQGAAWKVQGAWMARLNLPLDFISKALGEARTSQDWRTLLMRLRPGRDGEPRESSVLPITESVTSRCPARYRRMKLVATNPAQIPGASQPEGTGDLTSLPGRVFTPEQRKQMALAGMLDQYIRDRIRPMLEQEKHDWDQVQSVSDWEHFRDPKLQALRRALGKFPEKCPLQTRVTSDYLGEGYRRENIVYQCQPGIWVTANLYRPAEPREQMPGIIILHSLHAPKTQVELQDMGIIWARAGCTVLVIDQVGYGERITTYPWDRENIHSRVVEAEQLYSVGSSLLTWMVWDTMRSIDLLSERPDINKNEIIVLGAVAGGGEPAAFAAAIDPRVAAVAPFNFGEGAPATARFIPEKNQWPSDLADPGLYDSDSTRIYRLCIADQFLPWFVCASVAPRRFIYSFEVGWNVEDLPAWSRYRKAFGLYKALDNLAEAHGFGPMPGPGECANIGPSQRKTLYPTLQRWFGIPNPGEHAATSGEERSEYQRTLGRRPASELAVLTPEIAKELRMKAVDEVAQEQGRAEVAAAREELAKLNASEQRKWLRTKWAEKLRNIDFNLHPQAKLEWSRQTKNAEAEALALEGEPGITVPMLLLRPAGRQAGRLPVVVAVSEDGKDLFLTERAAEIKALLQGGTAVALPDVRGTGETTPDFRRDPDGDEGMKANTVLMMGETLLGERLRDLRTVLAYLENRSDLDSRRIGLWGDSFWPANPDHLILDELPEWQIGPQVQSHAEPLGGLLALLGALYDDHVQAVAVHRGLVSFASILNSNFSYVPQDVIVPEILEVGDIADVAAALAPRALFLKGPVDGQDRLVSSSGLHQQLQPVYDAYRGTAPAALSILAGEGPSGISTWFLEHRH
jgi:dienelactone hydrolase